MPELWSKTASSVSTISDFNCANFSFAAEISAEMENQERVRLYDKAEKALNSAAEFIIEELKKQ